MDAFFQSGMLTNVSVSVDQVTAKVEIRWEEPDVTNGIITGYNFTVKNWPSLSSFILGSSPKYIMFDSLGLSKKFSINYSSLFVSFIVIETGIPYTFSLTAHNLCGASTAYTYTFFTGEKRMLFLF